MANHETVIKLNMEMLVKSISCLPLSLISLCSSYLTMEEASLKSPYVIQTPFFDPSALKLDSLDNFGLYGDSAFTGAEVSNEQHREDFGSLASSRLRGGKGLSSTNTTSSSNPILPPPYRSSTSSSSSSSSSSSHPKVDMFTYKSGNEKHTITIDIGNGMKMPLLTWKDSLLSCLEHYLEAKPFTLKIKAKSIHKGTIVGISPSYDITLCDSEYFFITKELLEKAISEMSMRTGNGEMMLSRYCWAFAYIYNMSISGGILGSFQNTSNDMNLEEEEQEDEEEEEEEKENDEKSNLLSTQPLISSLKIVDRTISIYDIRDDEDEESYLSPITTDNTLSGCTDTHFLDEHKIVDSQIERSYLLAVGCANLLVTLDGILKNMTDVTPERPTTTKEDNNVLQEEYGETSTNKKIKNFPKSDVKYRNDVHTVVIDKDVGYNVYTSAKQVLNILGVWGNDDLYLRYLADLRKLQQPVGYDVMKDHLMSESQGSFGGYLSTEKSSSSSSSSSSSKTSSSSSHGEPVQAEFVYKKWQNEMSMMYEERDIYCQSVELAVSSVFKSLADFMCTVDFRFRKILENYKSTKLSSSSSSLQPPTTNSPFFPPLVINNKKRFIFERTKFADEFVKQNLGTREEGQKKFEEEHKRINANTSSTQSSSPPSNSSPPPLRVIYKGSVDYQKLAEYYKPERDALVELMDTDGTLPFYPRKYDDIVTEQQQQQKQQTRRVYKATTYSDYYQMRHYMSVKDFVKIVKNSNTVDTSTEFPSIIASSSLDFKDISIAKTFNESELGDFYHYEIVELQVGSYYGEWPVLCLYGVPEALLYDEMASFKWLSTLWKAKIVSDSKSFNNIQNNRVLNRYTLLELSSRHLQAKSFVMMSEYQSCAFRFDKYFLNKRIFKNLVPSSRVRVSSGAKSGGEKRSKRKSSKKTLSSKSKKKKTVKRKEGEEDEEEEEEEAMMEGNSKTLGDNEEYDGASSSSSSYSAESNEEEQDESDEDDEKHNVTTKDKSEDV